MAFAAIKCLSCSMSSSKIDPCKTSTCRTTICTILCRISLPSRLHFKSYSRRLSKKNLRERQNKQKLLHRKLRSNWNQWTIQCYTSWSFASSLKWTITWCIWIFLAWGWQPRWWIRLEEPYDALSHSWACISVRTTVITNSWGMRLLKGPTLKNSSLFSDQTSNSWKIWSTKIKGIADSNLSWRTRSS